MILKRFKHTVQSESMLDALLCSTEAGDLSCYISTKYAIAGNTDDVEGRGTSVTRKIADTQQEANGAALGVGPSCSAGDVYTIEALYIDIEINGKRHAIAVQLKDIFISDTLEDENERLKKSALAKLTPQEKAALGLK